MKPKLLTEKEAQDQFKLLQYDPLGGIDYDTIVLLDGDVELSEDIEDGTLAGLFSTEEKPIEERALFIIQGDLKVKGDIHIVEDMPCLLVLGDVHCEVLHSFDNQIYITGDAHIKYAFNGNYNHGSISIEGTSHVPYLLNSDHDSSLEPSEDTVVINYYTDYDDFFTYDYYSDDIPEIVVEEALDDDGELDYEKFIEILKSGGLPLKIGGKTRP